VPWIEAQYQDDCLLLVGEAQRIGFSESGLGGNRG
jgi:hypothetical protein